MFLWRFGNDVFIGFVLFVDARIFLAVGVVSATDGVSAAFGDIGAEWTLVHLGINHERGATAEGIVVGVWRFGIFFGRCLNCGFWRRGSFCLGNLLFVLHLLGDAMVNWLSSMSLCGDWTLDAGYWLSDNWLRNWTGNGWTGGRWASRLRL